VVFAELLASALRALGCTVRVEHLCQWWWRFQACMKDARRDAKHARVQRWADAVCPECFGAERSVERTNFLCECVVALRSQAKTAVT
jgi:hypothetical protein